jgi:hypothetical protein
MFKFGYLYAMPGFISTEISESRTDVACFYTASVDIMNKETAVDVARHLVKEYNVSMIELCGGLANATLVSAVKDAVGPNVAVGQVMYGPEYRRTLVDLLNL